MTLESINILLTPIHEFLTSITKFSTQKTILSDNLEEPINVPLQHFKVYIQVIQESNEQKKNHSN